MPITKAEAAELNRLYNARETLQRNKAHAGDRNFWIGMANVELSNEARGADVINALGGAGAFADMMTRATLDKLEELMREMDGEISELGGQP